MNRQGVGEVHDLMIGPLPANPLAWNVLAETETAYRYGTFRWLPRPSLELSPRELEKPRSSPLLDAAGFGTAVVALRDGPVAYPNLNTMIV